MAKQARVWTGSQWDSLAVTLPDLSNYSTTTQMNTAISNASVVTKIVANTFSGVTAVNLSNVLSDTYKYYRLYLYGTITTSPQDIIFRFRQNTTDVTAGYYEGGTFGTYTGTTGSFNNKNNANGFGINQFGTNAGDWSLNIIDIIRPDATSGLVSGFAWQASGALGGSFAGKCLSMTNFNGLTFLPNANTITGGYELVGIS